MTALTKCAICREPDAEETCLRARLCTDCHRLLRKAEACACGLTTDELWLRVERDAGSRRRLAAVRNVFYFVWDELEGPATEVEQ